MMMGMMILVLIVGGVLCLPFMFRWSAPEQRDDLPLPKRKRQMSELSSAETMLEERYAQGEISRGEYLEMREDLRR